MKFDPAIPTVQQLPEATFGSIPGYSLSPTPAASQDYSLDFRPGPRLPEQPIPGNPHAEPFLVSLRSVSQAAIELASEPWDAAGATLEKEWGTKFRNAVPKIATTAGPPSQGPSPGDIERLPVQPVREFFREVGREVNDHTALGGVGIGAAGVAANLLYYPLEWASRRVPALSPAAGEVARFSDEARKFYLDEMARVGGGDNTALGVASRALGTGLYETAELAAELAAVKKITGPINTKIAKVSPRAAKYVPVTLEGMSDFAGFGEVVSDASLMTAAARVARGTPSVEEVRRVDDYLANMLPESSGGGAETAVQDALGSSWQEYYRGTTGTARFRTGVLSDVAGAAFSFGTQANLLSAAGEANASTLVPAALLTALSAGVGVRAKSLDVPGFRGSGVPDRAVALAGALVNETWQQQGGLTDAQARKLREELREKYPEAFQPTR